MVIYSWQEYWHIPQDQGKNNLAGLAMNIFLLTSMADSIQSWDPDSQIYNLHSDERLRAIRAGEATPLGTTNTPEEIETILLSKKYPNTIESTNAIRIPTPFEICLQLLPMMSTEWKMYNTYDPDVPYVLCNNTGDVLSPVEIFDSDTEEMQILRALPVKRVSDVSIIDELYQSFSYRKVNTKEELIGLYPNTIDHIERAFKPGAPVLSIIKEARDSGIEDLAVLGSEVVLITSILRIKSRLGINRILSL